MLNNKLEPQLVTHRFRLLCVALPLNQGWFVAGSRDLGHRGWGRTPLGGLAACPVANQNCCRPMRNDEIPGSATLLIIASSCRSVFLVFDLAREKEEESSVDLGNRDLEF